MSAMVIVYACVFFLFGCVALGEFIYWEMWQFLAAAIILLGCSATGVVFHLRAGLKEEEERVPSENSDGIYERLHERT